MALTKVTSAVIKDATITDADIGSTLTSAISGSTTAVSSSIATRFDSRETDMTLATASIALNESNMTLATASIAAITASLGQPVNTDSNVTFGNITSTGTITATEVHTTFVSSSIAVASGSNNFGDASDDHHSFTGSVSISGSLVLKDNADFNGDLDVDGTTNLDVVDIDGAVDMASTLTIGDDLTIPNKIVHSGDTNTFTSFGADSLSIYLGGTQAVEFIYNNIYIKQNNTGLIGYTTGGSAKELIKIDASDTVQIGEAQSVTMTGSLSLGDSITQSKAGNLTHTMTAGGSGEAALRLIANNTTGDPFIRFETNAKTFCMGIDNSDSDKFMLDLGSDPGADTIFNVQPDGSLITFDKAVNVNNSLIVSPNGAKFSVGASITGSCGTAMDVMQIGHTSQWYCETSDAADRNVYIGNNFYHDGTNHKPIYEDEVSGIQFRAGTIRFRTAGVTGLHENLDAGGGTERMRVTKEGNVGIGTTNPGQLLHVASAGNAYVAIDADSTGAGNDNAGLLLQEAGNDMWTIRNEGNSSNRLAILDEGFDDGVQLAQNGSGFSDISDERTKTDLVTITDAVDKINSLRAVNFKWKYGSEERRTKNNIGIIAQDVYKVLPEAVTIPEEDYKVVDHPKWEGEKQAQNVWTVDKGKLTILLIKAVQELSEKIEHIEKTCKCMKEE